MNLNFQCIPCLVRQTVEIGAYATQNQELQRKIIRHILHYLATHPGNVPPPMIARYIQNYVSWITGESDPYRGIKQKWTRIALEYLPILKSMVENAENPFQMAVQLALAGNIIDFGVLSSYHLSESSFQQTIMSILSEPVEGDMDQLRTKILRSRSILYVADNAGELVFDRLLFPFLRPARIIVAVRGGPIINDVVMEDAVQSQLEEDVQIIDTGINLPGVIPELSSPSFQNILNSVDLVIAKGQGNFETLHSACYPLVFLFKVKCPVVASFLNVKLGTLMIYQKE